MYPEQTLARKELEKSGISFSKQGFFRSVRYGNAEEVQLFLKAGMSPDARKETEVANLPVSPLMRIAILEDLRPAHLKIAQIILDAGADPNKTNAANITALYLAAHRGHDQLARLLIRAGADVSIATHPISSAYEPQSPLYIAAANHHTDVAKILLQHGADPNRRGSSSGHTPLIRASSQYESDASVELVRALLEAGADVNETNFDGRTALHRAASLGNTEIVRALLDAGANPNFYGVDGNSPLSLAREEGYMRIVSLLRSAGATS